MSYQVEVGKKADAQLAELDAAIGASIERKILWLVENATAIVHRRLVGMAGRFSDFGFPMAGTPWRRNDARDNDGAEREKTLRRERFLRIAHGHKFTVDSSRHDQSSHSS
jgi:hypothetical protein